MQTMITKMAKNVSNQQLSLDRISKTPAASSKDEVLSLSPYIDYVKTLPHTEEFGDQYYIGDIYPDSPISLGQEWEINSHDMPYLSHIKRLSSSWPQLRYLADFMEVSTTPLRWKYVCKNPLERKERAARVKISVLDFSTSSSNQTSRTDIDSVSSLQNFLQPETTSTSQSRSLRLYFVEDLSRSVIEMLGTKYDIDPLFFRHQIDEYAWYNIRDKWMNPAQLSSSIKHQTWFRLRHVRARYFRSSDSFQKARDESAIFNVLRRPDGDHNHWGYMDEKGYTVGLTRTRTSVWIGKDSETEGMVGIVLVDPTVIEGNPIWHGCVNWTVPTSMHATPPLPYPPPRDSLFEQLIYWSQRYPWSYDHQHVPDQLDLRVIVEPLLHTVCAEWLLLADYLKTRISQIEWELGFPERFRSDVIDKSLNKLHVWRRLNPLFQEMVSETIRQTLPQAQHLTCGSTARERTKDHVTAERTLIGDLGTKISQTLPDYEQVLTILRELQARTDRLTAVVTASMSIEDSRRGIQENQNIARLAWLATIFVPMTFLTGFFSMQADITTLRETIGWYFAAAIPVTAITLLVATNPIIQQMFVRKKVKVR